METVMQAQRFPHLLELIGNKMDVEDLWKLRQTCWNWHKEFIPALRDKQKPVLLNCNWKDTIVPTLPTLENATTSSSTIAIPSPLQWNNPNFLSKHSLRGYTDIMRSSNAIPAAKYTLIDIHSSPSRLLVLADFFKVCGPYITHLKLWINGTYNNSNAWDPVDIASLRQIIFHQVPNYPNLKDLLLILPYLQPDTPVLEAPAVATRDLSMLRKLSFSVIPVGSLGSVAVNGLHLMYRNLLADLLGSTTGLHTLEFGSGSRSCERSALEAIRLVREVMSEDQVSKIKTLEIHDVRVPHLEILLDLAGWNDRKNPLRLKSFCTSIINNIKELLTSTRPVNYCSDFSSRKLILWLNSTSTRS